MTCLYQNPIGYILYVVCIGRAVMWWWWRDQQEVTVKDNCNNPGRSDGDLDQVGRIKCDGKCSDSEYFQCRFNKLF